MIEYNQIDKAIKEEIKYKLTTLQLEKKMETKDWIQLVLGIATLLTAGAALANVFILRRQRRDSQKPILQLQDAYYAHNFGDFIVHKNFEIVNNRVDRFELAIVNSGYGVANNISVHCYFDIQKLVQELNAELFIEFEGVGIRFLEDEEKVYTNDLFKWKTINYILPYSREERQSFGLNSVYEALILRINKNNKSDEETFKSFVSSILYVNLEYYDSLQNKYEDYYQISQYSQEGLSEIVFNAKRITRSEFCTKRNQALRAFKNDNENRLLK